MADPVEDADRAAQYYERLVAKGVPPKVAEALTCAWILAARSREPWEDESR